MLLSAIGVRNVPDVQEGAEKVPKKRYEICRGLKIEEEPFPTAAEEVEEAEIDEEVESPALIIAS